MISILFWTSLLLVAYHHVVYPMSLRVVAGRLRKPAIVHLEGSTAAPTATLIIPAHNEEDVIAAKIHNTQALEYEPGKLRIIVALDGCTDRTRQCAEAAISEAPRRHALQLVDHPRNRGKVALLNEHIALAQSDIVALSDTSAMLDANAMRRGASHFQDSKVGVVSGTYITSAPLNPGETSYWSYQTRIKADESTLGSLMGAHGAFYLFRRSLWKPLEEDVINDDFILPGRILAAGFRGVYDSGIAARELEESSPKHEFFRRVRLGAGNMQQSIRLRRLGLPKYGWVAFTFLSGKGLRGVMPLILLILTLSNLLLAVQGQAINVLILCGQLALVAMVLVVLSSKPRRPILNKLAYAALGYAGLAAGAFIYLLGMKNWAWRASRATKGA